MPSRAKKGAAPLTIDLPLSLIAKIHDSRKKLGLKTTSDVVRYVIGQFDFEACTPPGEPHRQISVRVSASQRALLKRFAKKKHASVGELLRLALGSLPAKSARRA